MSCPIHRNMRAWPPPTAINANEDNNKLDAKRREPTQKQKLPRYMEQMSVHQCLEVKEREREERERERERERCNASNSYLRSRRTTKHKLRITSKKEEKREKEINNIPVRSQVQQLRRMPPTITISHYTKHRNQ